MNTFLEDLADDLDNTFINTDEFAQTVIYDNGTIKTEIDAIVTFGSKDGKHIADHAEILVRKTDVPNPEYKQVFEIDGNEYKIISDTDKTPIVSTEDNLCWEIKILANERFSSWRK